MGAAKFLDGLSSVIGGEELRIIVNTADDEEFYGLHVSPDIDTVVYTLAGIVDQERGWGIGDDTFNCLEMLGRYGLETWFRIGDRDLATNLYRTMLLRQGFKISKVTEAIASKLGVRHKVIPMSDDPVRTYVDTGSERLPFQRYFVERGTDVPVKAVEYMGAAEARPAEGVIESIVNSRAVIVAPSNPVASIGPILAIKGIREALRSTPARTIAISPIISGRTVKGPADKMMAGLGIEPSALGVAMLYRDFLRGIVIDKDDEGLKPAIEELHLRCFVTDTIMRSREDRVRLAAFTLSALEEL